MRRFKQLRPQERDRIYQPRGANPSRHLARTAGATVLINTQPQARRAAPKGRAGSSTTASAPLGAIGMRRSLAQEQPFPLGYLAWWGLPGMEVQREGLGRGRAGPDAVAG